MSVVSGDEALRGHPVQRHQLQQLLVEIGNNFHVRTVARPDCKPGLCAIHGVGNDVGGVGGGVQCRQECILVSNLGWLIRNYFSDRLGLTGLLSGECSNSDIGVLRKESMIRPNPLKIDGAVHSSHRAFEVLFAFSE